MKLNLLGDRVAIKQIATGEKNKGCLIIPESTTEGIVVEGIVVEVGTGKMLDDGTFTVPTYKIGDKILFEKYSQPELDFNDETIVIVRGEEVVGVVSE